MTYAFRGFGQNPLDTLLSIGIEVRGNLRFVSPMAATAAATTLGVGTVFAPGPELVDPLGGVSQAGPAVPILNPSLASHNWVQEQLGKGRAVLIRPTDNLDVIATTSPAAIAASASPNSPIVGGPFAILVAPDGLVSQAQAIAAGPVQPPVPNFVPGVTCPAGTVDDGTGHCVAAGGGAPPPQPIQQASALPSWALPVGIGVGALLLVVAFAGKRAAPVRANPFRRNKPKRWTKKRLAKWRRKHRRLFPED